LLIYFTEEDTNNLIFEVISVYWH